MKFLDKLKAKWGIESNVQILLIMIVFALAGFSILHIRRFLFPLLGIAAEDPFWLKTIVWLVAIFPVYNIFLLLFAALFGQFDFFWQRIKKTLKKIRSNN